MVTGVVVVASICRLPVVVVVVVGLGCAVGGGDVATVVVASVCHPPAVVVVVVGGHWDALLVVTWRLA